MISSPVKIEVTRSIDILDDIARQYESLLARADWVNPYFSPEWLQAWWKRQKQDRKPLFLTAHSKTGELLGYWPLLERPGLLGSKGLWPFVYDEANYHFPTCSQAVSLELVHALEKLLKSFLFIWLPQIPQRFWDFYLSVPANKENHLTIIRSSRVSHFIKPDEEKSFAQFWEEKLGVKSRKSWRYDERSLADRGEVCWETIDSFEGVRSAMPSSCMIEVTSRKALENAGLYSIRGRRGFFFELLPELARKKRVRLSFLRVDDQPVAWQLELLSPGRSFLHHLAFDENWKKYSPGKQLLKRCIELCWEENRVLDFLPAIFAYKERYANLSEPIYELHWIQKSIRGRIARRLIRWNMNWRQKMRERSPGLVANVARAELSNEL